MKTLSHDDLKKLNEVEHADFLLINVLNLDAFNQQHIRTSISIPLETENFSKLVDIVAGHKNRKIVVYCASFDCDASTKAAQILEEDGFKDVWDYEGGTKEWFEYKKAA